MPTTGKMNREHEDHPWTIEIPDHPARTDSEIYIASRAAMNRIIKTLHGNYLGQATSYQDHHGGGLWVKDKEGWFIVKNVAGLEWSQQFCADPAKVDQLRQFAIRLYQGFPDSIPALQEMIGTKYKVQELLNHEIKTEQDVANWCDSLFNASVPLPQAYHTGVLQPGKAGITRSNQPIGGVHHYPTPITDIQLFKRDDFELWVVDEEGNPAAVLPIEPMSKGNQGVRVTYATPGSKLHEEWMKKHLQETPKALIKPRDHDLAKQAFRRFR